MNLIMKKKSHRSMLLVLAVFLLPILLAKLALMQHWFNYGVTNQGTLISNELSLTKLGIDKNSINSGWLVIYRLPSYCDSSCEQILNSVNNTYVALGKDKNRVTPVALFQQVLTEQQLAGITSHKWQMLPLSTETESLIEPYQVLIVDPLGNVVLSHQPPEQTGELAMFGKAILADLQKLLKYSRIG